MNRVEFNQNFKSILKKGKIRLIPLVLAASMVSGCGSKKVSCKPIENQSSSLVSSVLEDIEDFSKKEDTLNYFFNNWGYECEKIGDKYYNIKRDYNNGMIYCASLEEFREYVDVSNPTYSDVREAILENPSISDKYEKWLLDGLDNLESSGESFDLVALYYNVKRMNIIEITLEEMIDEIGSPGAYFTVEDGNVYVCVDDVTNYALCHEVFGHGLSDVQIKKEGLFIRYMPNILVMYADYDNAEYEIKDFGLSLEEGKADLISDIATGRHSGGPYDMEAEQLRIFNETTGISLGDFVSKGTLYLIDNMKKNDIDYPVKYIEGVDGLLDSVRDSKFDFDDKYTMESNMRAYFKDYADDKINEGIISEIVKKRVQEVIDASEYDVVKAGELFIYDVVSMSELKEEVLNDIDDIEAEKKLSKSH